MKTTNTLPAKKTQSLGVFKEKNHNGQDTTVTTDTSSLLSLSTTHVFNR